jgi:hypothetical protein
MSVKANVSANLHEWEMIAAEQFVNFAQIDIQTLGQLIDR